MNKITKYISRIIISCLTMVLFINANSASCYLLNEPKEPKSISDYKIFK